MITKVTSITLHKTALGDQAAITYSVIDASGSVISQNKRAEAVIMEGSVLNALESIYQYAQGKVQEG